MRARLELMDVTCYDPEDVVDTDMFYLLGGVNSGADTNAVLLPPMGFRAGQTRHTFPENSVMFDQSDLPSDLSRQVHLAIQAYDQDLGHDWAKYRDTFNALAEEIAKQIENLPRDPRDPGSPQNRQVAAAIIRGIAKFIDIMAGFDRDDFLGTHVLDLPVGGGNSVQKMEAPFKGMVFPVWSEWNYVLRYRITQWDGAAALLPAAKYTREIRLMHQDTMRMLHSHPINYGHPGTSGQQQVTAYEWLDDNDFWRVKGPYGQPDNFRTDQLVQHGDIIRLQHVLTGRNLHSHSGIPSPITHQQEVTCYGEGGNGDTNDNWRVEVEGGGAWDSGKRVQLIHTNTNHSLHSHYGQTSASYTADQQEVTCYENRDINDWWLLFEMR
jgi:hypothetical protein